MEHPLLVFINPLSGGGLAEYLMDSLVNYENVYVIRLPDEAENWSDRYRDLLNNSKLRILAAGGDGTVNWIVSLLSGLFPLNFTGWKPPIAIAPFGTGNDLSISLGWGSGLTLWDIENLNPILDRIDTIPIIENVDVWELIVSRLDTDEVVKKQMINYFSIGVDAHMASNFESCRRECQCCFCCQCMSKALYFPVGLASLFGLSALKDYCQVELEDISNDGIVNIKELDFGCFDQTLTVQNIPSIYGGRDLWRSSVPRSVNDKKLEVIVQGGCLQLGLTHFGVYLGDEVGQASRLHVFTNEPCYYQVDGEGMIVNGPATFTLMYLGSYPFLYSN